MPEPVKPPKVFFLTKREPCNTVGPDARNTVA